MIKNKCGHEQVCQECIRKEIDTLEKKLNELKKQLPPTNTIIIKDYVPTYPVPILPMPYPHYPPSPIWFSTSCINDNTQLC